MRLVVATHPDAPTIDRSLAIRIDSFAAASRIRRTTCSTDMALKGFRKTTRCFIATAIGSVAVAASLALAGQPGGVWLRAGGPGEHTRGESRLRAQCAVAALPADRCEGWPDADQRRSARRAPRRAKRADCEAPDRFAPTSPVITKSATSRVRKAVRATKLACSRTRTIGTEVPAVPRRSPLDLVLNKKIIRVQTPLVCDVSAPQLRAITLAAIPLFFPRTDNAACARSSPVHPILRFARSRASLPRRGSGAS